MSSGAQELLALSLRLLLQSCAGSCTGGCPPLRVGFKGRGRSTSAGLGGRTRRCGLKGRGPSRRLCSFGGGRLSAPTSPCRRGAPPAAALPVASLSGVSDSRGQRALGSSTLCPAAGERRASLPSAGPGPEHRSQRRRAPGRDF